MSGRHGETAADGASVLAQVRTAAARCPDDPFAQRTLAHAEQVFGDPATAVTLLGKLPATDAYAQYLRGVALLTAAPDAAARAAARPQAKAAFARSVKRDPTFYPALYRYALLQPPGEPALDALGAAQVLAPQVDGIRIKATLALIAARRGPRRWQWPSRWPFRPIRRQIRWRGRCF